MWLIVTHLFTVFQEGTALLYCHIDIAGEAGEIYSSDGVAGEAGFHTTRSVKPVGSVDIDREI